MTSKFKSKFIKFRDKNKRQAEKSLFVAGSTLSKRDIGKSKKGRVTNHTNILSWREKYSNTCDAVEQHSTFLRHNVIDAKTNFCLFDLIYGVIEPIREFIFFIAI